MIVLLWIKLNNLIVANVLWWILHTLWWLWFIFTTVGWNAMHDNDNVTFKLYRLVWCTTIFPLSRLWICLLPNNVTVFRNAFSFNYCPVIFEGIFRVWSLCSMIYLLMHFPCLLPLYVFVLNVFHCIDIFLLQFFHFRTTFVAYVPTNFPLGLNFITNLPMVCVECVVLMYSCVLIVIKSYLCFHLTMVSNSQQFTF